MCVHMRQLLCIYLYSSVIKIKQSTIMFGYPANSQARYSIMQPHLSASLDIFNNTANRKYKYLDTKLFTIN